MKISFAKNLFVVLLASLFIIPLSIRAETVTTQTAPTNSKTTVVIATNLGNFEIELDGEKAPETTKNFLSYVDDKFYDGLVFHRVIEGFMIQGGGMNAKLEEKKTKPEIKNEAANGLKNVRGTVAMARTPNPHSASSQFFVNLVDNNFLDYQSSTTQGFGYAVFGKVTSGMDVVDKIAKVKTATKMGFENVPVEPVTIQSVTKK